MNFLFPVYLWGISLVAIPIIIHLFNFQRPKKVLFPNVAFLKSAKQVSTSRNKLKNLLVLLMRMLFIAFIALAFAQPYLPKGNKKGNSNLVSIYLDNSYSMQNSFEGLPKLETAKMYIEKITQIFPKNTAFQLITNSPNSGNSYFMEASQILDKVSAIGYSSSSKPLSSIFDRQITALENNNSPLGNHIFYITDFQKNIFGRFGESLESDTVNNFYLIPIPNDAEANLSVDSAWVKTPFIKPLDNNTLVVRINNHGIEEANPTSLKLFINDKMVSTTTFTLKANEKAEIELNFSVEDGGIKKCALQIEDFPMTFDNTFYFTIDVAPKIKVLNLYDGDSKSMHAVFKGEEYFETIHTDIHNTDYSEITSANLIILQHIKSLDQTISKKLNDALTNGQSIIIVPPVNPNTQSYVDAFGISFTLNQKVEDLPWLMLSAPALENPFFDGVFEVKKKDINMPKAKHVLQWGNFGETILSFISGKPYLSAFPIGSGRLYAFASPIQPDFTDFSSHALFVPVMYKMAMGSINKNEKLAHDIGAPFVKITIDSLKKGDIFSLVKEDIRLIPPQRIERGQLLITPPMQDMSAGCYDILQKDAQLSVGKLAFNYASNESDLSTIDDESLLQLAKQNNIQLFETGRLNTFEQEFGEKNEALPLWRHAVLLALLALFIEGLVIRFWSTKA